MKIYSWCCTLLLIPSTRFLTVVSGFDYNLEPSEDTVILLTDDETGIEGVRTIFDNELTLLAVKEIQWIKNESGTTSDADVLAWQVLADGTPVDSGTVPLADVGRILPDTVSTGSVKLKGRGMHNIKIVLTVGESTITVEKDYRVYKGGVSLIPLLVVLILAMTTKMVRGVG
jgi:hypothetical protein